MRTKMFILQSLQIILYFHANATKYIGGLSVSGSAFDATRVRVTCSSVLADEDPAWSRLESMVRFRTMQKDQTALSAL